MAILPMTVPFSCTFLNGLGIIVNRDAGVHFPPPRWPRGIRGGRRCSPVGDAATWGVYIDVAAATFNYVLYWIVHDFGES